MRLGVVGSLATRHQFFDFVGGQVSQTSDEEKNCGKSMPLLGQRFDAHGNYIGSQAYVDACINDR